MLRISAAEAAKTFARGKLRQAEGQVPALEFSDGRRIALAGDDDTLGVLRDPRLKDFDFEAGGKFSGSDSFAIDPIHTRSLFAYQDGKRLMVTYWCDICYIRTYTPGKCWCCQEWTELSLQPPGAAPSSQ